MCMDLVTGSEDVGMKDSGDEVRMEAIMGLDYIDKFSTEINAMNLFFHKCLRWRYQHLLVSCLRCLLFILVVRANSHTCFGQLWPAFTNLSFNPIPIPSPRPRI